MRSARTYLRKAVVLSAAALLLAAPGCGSGGKEARTVAPRRGTIREAFSEPAKTRLAQTWSIAMPVDGRIARIALEPGDAVKKDQVLAAFDLEPLEEAVKEAKARVAELEGEITVKNDNSLEKTALADVGNTIKAGEQTLKAAHEQVEAERKRTERAETEAKRMVEALKVDAVTQSDVDDARLEADTALIELRKQEFYREATNFIYTSIQLGPRYIENWLGRKDLERGVLDHKLAQAKSQLARAEHTFALAALRAPIDGVVLERFTRGDGYFRAGERLLEIGNLAELEVEAEVLTQDALRLTAGTPVELEPASGLPMLRGTVKRIEPAGFTKLSSLGVEQQRVIVHVALEEKREGLGAGYRLQARFLTGSKDGALCVPRAAVLQAPDGTYHVFKADGGVLRKQAVAVGLRSDLELEIVEGLGESERVLAAPDATMRDGDAVKPLGD